MNKPENADPGQYPSKIIDINSSDYATMTYNSHYYTMAHLSKVIKPGARRIKAEGNTSDKIHYSAFENPDGSYSIVLLNEEDTIQKINITFFNLSITFSKRKPPEQLHRFRWLSLYTELECS